MDNGKPQNADQFAMASTSSGGLWMATGWPPMETALVVSNDARRLCRGAHAIASQSAHESGWLYRMIDKPFFGFDLLPALIYLAHLLVRFNNPEATKAHIEARFQNNKAVYSSQVSQLYQCPKLKAAVAEVTYRLLDYPHSGRQATVSNLGISRRM